MKIAVIGQGLKPVVGATVLASVGNDVFLDLTNTTEDLNFTEPGLNRFYSEQLSSGRLHLFDENELQDEVEIIVVADVNPLEYFEEIQSKFRQSIEGNAIFVLLTPSYIGEADELECKLRKVNSTSKVCCVPLLMREGCAITDFSRPNRIIVGCDDDSALLKVKSLFYPFNRVKDAVKVVAPREAEFSSFAGNAMLATRLSFMNEMANLAERLGVDIEVIRECIGSDPRIGKDYLYPGCGYGGTALDKNLEKVADELRTRSDDLGLLDVVSKINERQKDLIFRKIWSFFKTDLRDKKVAIWGASFKPGTANIESAPAIKLIDSLLAQGCEVSVYDPLAKENLRKRYANKITISNNAYQAIDNSDVLAICTEWKEFWSPDFNRIAESLKYKAIFDGRNLYNLALLKEFNLKYYGIGKGIT